MYLQNCTCQCATVSTQVGCVPWSLEGNSNVSMVTVVNGTTLGTGVCKYTPYVFLSCVMVSLSVALYLRVSSLPKILLLLLLNILHTVVMETSGYREAMGWVELNTNVIVNLFFSSACNRGFLHICVCMFVLYAAVDSSTHMATTPFWQCCCFLEL